MAPLKLFACVWSVALLSAVEQSVVAPSMWLYLRDLGGNQHVYSAALAAFLLGRVFALPCVGFWANYRDFGEVFRILVSLGLLASCLYSLSAWIVSPWTVVVGRGLLGVASAVSVATASFVALHTSKEERTKYLGINQILSNGMRVCGPGMNVIFVMLPTWDPLRSGASSRGAALFGALTDPGWFLVLVHCLTLLVLAFAYQEPRSRVSSPGEKQRPSLKEAAQHLWKSGGWVCWVMTFQNNFTNQTMLWALPILTDRTMGWGTLKNSYLFGSMAIMGLVAAGVVSCLATRKLQDRYIILVNQLIAGAGFLPLAFLGGCWLDTSNSHVAVVLGALIWTVGFQGQVPGIMALYSKIIGPENFSFYMASFSMVMTCSRIVCSLLIGVATNMCTVFATAAVIWMLQWAVVSIMWRRLSPDIYEAYHEARASAQLNISLREVERIAGS
eukprot:TRINITY_DN62444_c0_g1_i1.p1 TRINITY_DN62444_c0_g1~~TRINITY_DN62444_c0_g1_i1.p1  ORF type:complete len:444 (-),score=56.58 TRINITY_DN62444_c0_g1_i1:164-1495(-)